MAKIRKFVCYRRIDKKPYTRFSKFKKLSYVRSRPVCRVVRFDLGDPRKKYNLTLHLITTRPLQIRDNALESARQTATRFLEKNLGKVGFYFQVRVYPHHVLRENPLAAGAGADRMSTGMSHSFGKTIGIAARIKKGRPVLTVHVMKENAETGKRALELSKYKLPCTCRIIEEKIVEKKQAPAK
ncbi:50S ribosomal protein L16 [archaeon]|nr:50S ribosomal protein L16 [archaeon]